MSSSPVGCCLSMCPEKERKLREREGLLHSFEIDPDTKHSRRPRADPSKTVKSFARSAAGQRMNDPAHLRPGPVLLLTARYLLHNVASKRDTDWLTIYDFVFDRLRAIRQDVVIQRLDSATSIRLYEYAVRFHVFASQMLCERDPRRYDDVLNRNHLMECTKYVLSLYDRSEETAKTAEVSEENSSESGRIQMEALYLLSNLGETTALRRGLSLLRRYGKDPNFPLAVEISMACYRKNYVRVCRLIPRLPPLMICATMRSLRKLRRDALRIMSTAYNSKTLTFPAWKLQELLLYRNKETFRRDCSSFGIPIVEDKNVRFSKSEFKEEILLSNPEMYFHASSMRELIPDIFFDSGN